MLQNNNLSTALSQLPPLPTKGGVMANQRPLSADEVRNFIKQQVERAKEKGLDKRELLDTLLRDREEQRSRIRALLASSIKCLGIVGVDNRWYLEEYAPELTAMPAKEKGRGSLRPRTEELHGVTYIRMKTSVGLVTIEETNLKVVIIFQG